MNRSEKFFKELKELCNKYKVSIEPTYENESGYNPGTAAVEYYFEYMEEDCGNFESTVINNFVDGDCEL